MKIQFKNPKGLSIAGINSYDMLTHCPNYTRNGQAILGRIGLNLKDVHKCDNFEPKTDTFPKGCYNCINRDFQVTGKN